MKKELPLLDRMSIEDIMLEQSIHKYGKSNASVLASQGRTKMAKPTPQHPLIISVSELATWLRCRVKHHWSYQCGLSPIGYRLPLVTGEVGHLSMETWYRTADTWKGRKVNTMAKVADRILKKTSVERLPLEDKKLLRAMLVGYADWTRNSGDQHTDSEIGLNKCFPETPFVLPLTDDKSILVRGKLDNPFYPAAFKKTVATLEYKFKKKIEYDSVERLLQLTVYLWALRILYPKMREYSVYYTILRKQMPTPRVRTALFYREPIIRTDDEIDQWVLDTKRTMKDIVGAAVYPNPMDSCKWSCDYHIPCLLRGDKAQLKSVMNSEFTRERR